MPRKLPLGRTGSKHTKKKQKVKKDSTENFPVVELDMEAASDAGGTVEDVLDSLIGPRSSLLLLPGCSSMRSCTSGSGSCLRAS